MVQEQEWKGDVMLNDNLTKQGADRVHREFDADWWTGDLSDEVKP